MLFNRDAVERRFVISMIKAVSKEEERRDGQRGVGCVYALRTLFDRIAILCDSVPLVIAAFVAIRGREGSDRAPSRGAPLREHGGTDGRILQRDHEENRDGERDLCSIFHVVE